MHRLLIVAVGTSVAASASAAFEGPPPDEKRVYKTIGDVDLQMHLYYPPNHLATDQSPAVVFFFGGGWNGGTPKQFYEQSAYLASRGMVAMCAEYRTKKGHGTDPRACVRDGKSAVRWIRANAAELGVDPERIAAGGGSAGGHVAAATALAPGFEEAGEDQSVSCRPAALVLFNPVFDNSEDGYGYERVRAYWQDFSPLHNIASGAPPTIVFLGTRDKLIPVATAEKYKRRMTEAGARCDLHLYQGEPHGFFNKGRGDAYAKTLYETDRFLQSLGYLTGQPTIEP